MATSSIDLTSFDISIANGFLPSDAPVQQFRDPYYQSWDYAAHNLPRLLLEHQLRKTVLEMPCLTTEKLINQSEWRRAYVVLGFLLHAYVWAEEGATERVPAALAIPYLQVCSKLRIAPVASYACLCLWNYRVIDKSKSAADPDNLDCLVSFTGSRGESWFYMMSVAVEAQAGPLVAQIVATLENQALDVLMQGLEDLSDTLKKMTAIVGRMSEHLDPNHFYHVIRPWIMGFNNAASRGLPHGIIYETGSGMEPYQKYVGGSNGQTSLLPFLDTALGIEHGESNLEFLKEMSGYMPGKHVDFLGTVKLLPNFRELVMRYPSSTDLITSYDKAITSLKTLREKHIIVVSRYIVVPGRKITISKDAGPQGSAGSSPIPFLQSMKNDTTQSKLVTD